MRVAVKENGWQGIGLHLLGECLDVLVISSRFDLFWGACPRNHAQVGIFLTGWPIIFEVWIGLRE